MAEFNLRCPMRYPKKCDLLIADKERLEGPEKYKVFLMYQVDGNDDYLKDAIKEYFKSPLYFLYDSDDIRGLGVKFCKICKLAQACDFGVAVLSPENENVFMEVGLLIGLGKPCLYVVNESKLEDKNIKRLPFDISDQIVIKYDSEEKLLSELAKEVPIFMIKVQSISGYEKFFREKIKERLKRLTPEAIKVLKEFTSMGKIELLRKETQGLLALNKGDIGNVMHELVNLKFIKYEYRSNPISGSQEAYSIEETYRPILQELLFSD